jgi:hypothetical protein
LAGKRRLSQNLGFYPSGTHEIPFKPDGLEAGIYFFRLTGSSGKAAQGRIVITD